VRIRWQVSCESPQRDANERTTNTADREENAMNAIQLLRNEHETAKRAFGQIQAASAEQRAALWAKLQPELKVHEEIEETALYGPVAEEMGSSNETLREWQEHHREEVGELEALIQELEASDPTSDEWMEGIEELQQTLEHHIQEEEGDIWPRIQQAWDASKLEHAGETMAALKRQRMPRAA
jgi:hemerythrin-like domain-containing protein